MDFDILSIGHTAHDTFGVIEEMPNPDTANWLEELETQGGGAAAQAAVTASRLGLRAAFVGVVGDDSEGLFLRDDFLREGVNVEGLSLRVDARTSKAFILVERSNGRRTIFVHPGSVGRLQFDERLKALIRRSRSVHLDGTQVEVHGECAAFARSEGVLVSLDGCEIDNDPELTRDLVSQVDILIANERFPCQLTGLGDDDAALHALAAMGPKIVISTKGKKGCRLVEGRKIRDFGGYPVNVVDSTGAGDVFHGAFLSAHLLGKNLEEAIRFASACAAINCASLGGRKGIPSRDEAERFIEEQNFDSHQ